MDYKKHANFIVLRTREFEFHRYRQQCQKEGNSPLYGWMLLCTLFSLAEGGSYSRRLSTFSPKITRGSCCAFAWFYIGWFGR